VYRFFSTFPDRWPGIGLLLLRVAIGGTLILQGTAYLLAVPELRPEAWVTCLLSLASGALMVVGLVTPIAAALTVMMGVAMTLAWIPAPAFNFFQGNPLSLGLMMVALACACLGPGAFSLDAHFFGRRKIIIPSRARQAEF